MRRALITAGLIAVAVGVVSAHHSFAAFDTSAEKTISGTVKQFDWTNPHTWIWVDVANQKGSVDTYGFEGMSPNYLARRGWTKTTVKPGDTITVYCPASERLSPKLMTAENSCACAVPIPARASASALTRCLVRGIGFAPLMNCRLIGRVL